jgi:putative transposase
MGPTWLKSPSVATIVMHALTYGESQRSLYRMLAFVVMSNHVHLLIETVNPLQKITKLLKGYTARRANQYLSRVGQAFWQDESFDHWVRNSAELERIVHYIENNPVTAGLVNKAEDWAWSSAAWRAAEVNGKGKLNR